MIRFIRSLLLIFKPRITKAQALDIAFQYCIAHGWAISNPQAVRELRAWLVWINRNIKGSAWIKIDNQNGRIIATGVPKM